MATLADQLPGTMLPAPYRVAGRHRDTADTWTLELEAAEGEPIVPLPGQFTMLYAFGVGEVPISVSRVRNGRLVQTIRAVGATSRALCATRRGASVGVRGPYGSAWPIDAAEGADVAIVAGGIGLAPLRGAIDEVVGDRRRFGRVSILYGARTPADLLYARDVAHWGAASGVEVAVTVDAADTSWTGDVGVVTKLVARAALDPASTVAMVCGPEIMMRFAVQSLGERGVPAERIHVSLERNMHCAVALCGHCQLGTTLICRDGPVYAWPDVAPLLEVRDL
jgi:anaerobic sulfite reductase subunit B